MRSPFPLVMYLLLLALIANPTVLAAQDPLWVRDANPTAAENPPQLVVLVHGMGRTAASMLPLKFQLQRAGYRVLNFGYSSYGPSVSEIATDLENALGVELADAPAPEVHFVGHSLGNLVLREFLAHHEIPFRVGRLVMLAPPNRGAHTADRLAPYLEWVMPPIAELRTDAGGAVTLPPPAGVEFAVIAAREDDKVRLSETCLAGAKAHRIVSGGHTFILMRPDVADMIREFFATGLMPGDAAEGEPPCG